jgi:hypothetical protein
MRTIEVFLLVLLSVSAAGAQTTQKNQKYTGCVRGNAKDGYTVTLLSTKPSKDPNVASKPTSYSLEFPNGTKIDLVTLANQRVDVVGVLALVKANEAPGKPQTLTVKEIKIIPGGC